MILSENKYLNLAIPILLLIAGLYFVPLTLFNFNFSSIPGDMGDARFNNYILEHGYKFMTGQIHEYWNAPFMFPFKNVIALSDNLLGTVPIYVTFRSIGIDRETAFQCWFLVIFALNYICCFYALKKWSGHTTLAAVGAYIFAFGLFNHGEIFHAQVFPRFIAPLVFYWFWKYLDGKNPKYFLFFSVGLIYQFYCGIYLGFFLFYVLLFFFIAYIFKYRDWEIFKQYTKLRVIVIHLGIVIITVLIFLPLMIPYYEISKVSGVRSYEAAFNSLPRLQSYFFTSPASVIWKFLYPYTAFTFPDWWNHFLFTGITAWLGILFAPFILFSKKITESNKSFIFMLLLGFLLSLLFCLNINGFSLYKIIFQIPGFSSMRSLDRIINVQVIFLILITVFVLKEMIQIYPILKNVILFLPVLVILDNLIVPEPHKSFVKSDAQNDVNFIVESIRSQLKNNSESIAYIPIGLLTASENQKYDKTVSTTLSTMLATQELGISCVNGYTGFNPGNFENFFLNPNENTLQAWCDFNKIDRKGIQIINELGLTIIKIEKVTISASNQKYICADDEFNDAIAANKDHAFDWETFTLVKLEDNKCLLISHRKYYWDYNEKDGKGIFANSSTLHHSNIFNLYYIDNQEVMIQATNGKYLNVDDKSNQLTATAETKESAMKFIIYVKKE